MSNGLLELGLADFSRAISLGLGSLFQTNANIASGAYINETQIVVGDVLGPNNVRSDREDHFGLLAFFVFLSEEIS